jgi:hypothetical protein
MEREEEIRLIAYRIWEEEGRPQALDFDHWLKAEAMWRERHGQARTGYGCFDRPRHEQQGDCPKAPYLYTAKTHVHNILEKLALHTRLEIASWVHRQEVA